MGFLHLIMVYQTERRGKHGKKHHKMPTLREYKYCIDQSIFGNDIDTISASFHLLENAQK